jgi:hypothetical protein
MLPRLLNAILIGALLACPTCCHLGMCCGLGGQAGVALHASKPQCPNCASKESGQSPAPRGPHSRGHADCQGICGGAVLTKAVTPQDGLSPAADWLAPIASEFLDRASGTATWVSLETGPVRSGRVIRQLHMSFVC